MTHLIDSEKLTAEIKRLDEKYRTIRVNGKLQEAREADLVIKVLHSLSITITSLQQEQPMPNSTELIAKWEEEKDVLKQMDFRGDEWRLAQNAFMDGVGIGLSVKQQPSRKEHKGSWIEETKKELQHEEELLDMRLETLRRIRDKKNQFKQEQPEVDLEKEIEKYYYDRFAFISSVHNPTLVILTDIAKHFYELGLKARKEE